jgi:hypothetical protein
MGCSETIMAMNSVQAVLLVELQRKCIQRNMMRGMRSQGHSPAMNKYMGKEEADDKAI